MFLQVSCQMEVGILHISRLFGQLRPAFLFYKNYLCTRTSDFLLIKQQGDKCSDDLLSYTQHQLEVTELEGIFLLPLFIPACTTPCCMVTMGHRGVGCGLGREVENVLAFSRGSSGIRMQPMKMKSCSSAHSRLINSIA